MDVIQDFQPLIATLLTLTVGGIGWVLTVVLKINTAITKHVAEQDVLKKDVSELKGKVDEHHDYISFHRGIDAATGTPHNSKTRELPVWLAHKGEP